MVRRNTKSVKVVSAPPGSLIFEVLCPRAQARQAPPNSMLAINNIPCHRKVLFLSLLYSIHTSIMAMRAKMMAAPANTTAREELRLSILRSLSSSWVRWCSSSRYPLSFID
jgi:hypothetical protein